MATNEKQCPSVLEFRGKGIDCLGHLRDGAISDKDNIANESADLSVFSADFASASAMGSSTIAMQFSCR
jgi:hypothetical protein